MKAFLIAVLIVAAGTAVGVGLAAANDKVQLISTNEQTGEQTVVDDDLQPGEPIPFECEVADAVEPGQTCAP